MRRRTFLKLAGALSAAPLLRPFAVAAGEPEASLILCNGKVVTLDGAGMIAEAIAVRGERILALGPTDRIRAFAGRETTLIDLHGKSVTPGLIDAHAHLPPFGSRELYWVKLQGLPTKEAILERIAERVRQTPPGGFINAWGVESTELSYLSRGDLDEVSSRHPILAVHTTGQWGFANSAALKLARIDGATPSPPGSLIEKGWTGRPTGLLIHYPALYLVRRAIPAPDAAMLRRAITHAAELYCREGVTAVHDNFFMVTGMSSVESARFYFEMAASGRLPVRVKVWLYLPTLADTRDAVAQLFSGARPDTASPFHELGELRRGDAAAFARVWGGLKIAVDGSGPTGGWYRNPQALMLHSPAELRQMVALIHGAGQQVSIHATGDQAVDAALDAIEAAQNARGRPDARHRIEHAMLPREIAFRRFSEAGVVVTTHPQFIYAWGDRWQGARKEAFIPLRSFVEAGVPLALGADPPAFPLWQPQYALWQAAARVTRRGQRFLAGESIPVAQALRLHTLGSAYAAFQERELGSLEPGKLADMVVWDRDILTVPAGEIREAKALTTILGGKIVFSREPDRAGRRGDLVQGGP